VTLIVGSEVQSYQHSVAPTGVPRVLHETHRHLEEVLAADGIDVVPVSTKDVDSPAPRIVGEFLSLDPVVAKPWAQLDDVDVLLLLEPSPLVDFGRVVKVKRQRRLPVIAMINDLMPVQHPECFQSGADHHYRVLFQQILHVADHLIVPSHAVHRDLQTLGWTIRPEIHVSHLGTSFPQMPPRADSGERLDLLYVSTLAPRKGHDRLLAAFDHLRAEGKDPHLTLVGRVGWEVDDLIERIRTHPCFGNSLRWIEHGDDACVRALMTQATVAVLPAEGEGFGLFLEEALSAGLPVVVTDLPVFRERENPNVFFVEQSVEALTEGIMAAGRATPEPLGPAQVRTMRAFGEDVASIILSEVRQPI